MRGDPADRPKAVVIRTRRKPEGHKELIAALALAAYLVQPGDTLSGIAASHGVSLAAVEGANTKIADFNLIYAGQTVEIPGGSPSASCDRTLTPQLHGPGQQPEHGRAPHRDVLHFVVTHLASTATTASTATRSSSSGSTSGYSSSSLSDIPGVPASLAACVAYRESTDLQNPAARGNAYGIIPASGYNVYGTSLAHQKQVFAELYGRTAAVRGRPTDAREPDHQALVTNPQIVAPGEHHVLRAQLLSVIDRSHSVTVCRPIHKTRTLEKITACLPSSSC